MKIRAKYCVNQKSFKMYCAIPKILSRLCVVLRNIQCAVNCQVVKTKWPVSQVARIKIKRRDLFSKSYKSLPALWDVKSMEYSNRQEIKDAYAILLDKYRERYTEANRQDVPKNVILSARSLERK